MRFFPKGQGVDVMCMIEILGRTMACPNERANVREIVCKRKSANGADVLATLQLPPRTGISEGFDLARKRATTKLGNDGLMDDRFSIAHFVRRAVEPVIKAQHRDWRKSVHSVPCRALAATNVEIVSTHGEGIFISTRIRI